MNFMFFIYIPLAHSASHTFMNTYTMLNGQAFAGTSDISAVTTLDEQQIDYYDSDTGTLRDRWKKYTEIRERVQQINKLNITDLMQQFSHSQGVHLYRRMYGCVWDDETEVSHWLDDHDYDGQHFITLDLKEGRYTAHVPQADSTVLKWNNNREQLDFLKQYYKHECIDWLKEFLNFSKDTLKKTVIVSELPGQSLKNLTVDDTKGSGSSFDPSYFMYAAIIILPILILIALYALWINWKKLKTYYNNIIYYKVQSSSPVEEASQPPLPHQTTESFNKD